MKLLAGLIALSWFGLASATPPASGWRTLDALTVEAGDTWRFDAPSCAGQDDCDDWLLLDVAGDVTVNGALQAPAWNLAIRTAGDLRIAGSLAAGSLWLQAGRQVDVGGSSVDLSSGVGERPHLIVDAGSVLVTPGADLSLAQRVRDNEWAVLLPDGGSVRLVSGSPLLVQSPVPEAETWAMLLVGLGLLGLMSRKRIG